ncbi:acylneuraminate cytidylyltransferase family protein [Rubrimonas sp.]|uniref:acylneuraminate cytidylyltransferase family protein n=1 Tax=Rubrimonas sp. TaxID=2036015 RepID=UPI002FDD7ACA
MLRPDVSGRVIAIIPARGGSKGLPGKNLAEIGRLPLIGRAVRAAAAAARVEAVYVSTDDAAIAAAARVHGAVVIERPAAISGDAASSEAALLHALDAAEAADGQVLALAFLQCTSPFTEGAHVDAVLAPVLAGEAESAFSAAPSHGFLWTIGADGLAEGVNHDHALPRQRRQDRTPEYLETGAVYAMRTDTFRATGGRFCGRTRLVPLDAPLLEIDDAADLALARALWAAREVEAADAPA